MLLPNNEHTFYLKIQGEKTSEWFEGTFVCCCVISNGEQMEVAIRTDRYNAGSKSLPEQYKLFSRIIAELELRIKKAPTWWKESNGGWDLHDANVVHEVFAKVMEGEKVWADRLKEKADEAEKAAEKNPAKHVGQSEQTD